MHVAASGAQLSFQRPFKVIGDGDSIPDPSRPTRHKIATRITANSAMRTVCDVTSEAHKTSRNSVANRKGYL